MQQNEQAKREVNGLILRVPGKDIKEWLRAATGAEPPEIDRCTAEAADYVEEDAIYLVPLGDVTNLISRKYAAQIRARVASQQGQGLVQVPQLRPIQ